MSVTKLLRKNEQEKNLTHPESWGVVGKDYNAIVDNLSEIIDNLGADDIDFTALSATVDQLGIDLAAAQVSIAALPAELMIELTQANVATTSGLLVEGTTYVIHTLEVGDDFANVGYVSEGTAFVATGTTPTAWTESTSVINVDESAPSITSIVNGIGAITWARTAIGVYSGTKSNSFPAGYTFIHQKVIIPAADSAGMVAVSLSSDDAIVVNTYSDAGVTLVDGILAATPIHITVYPQPA